VGFQDERDQGGEAKAVACTTDKGGIELSLKDRVYSKTKLKMRATQKKEDGGGKSLLVSEGAGAPQMRSSLGSSTIMKWIFADGLGGDARKREMGGGERPGY